MPNKPSQINALPGASRIFNEHSNPNSDFGARSRQCVTGLWTFCQKMKIPTEKQLAGSKPYCLDTEWMLKNFLGKTKEEAIELMNSTGGISEDFAYMAAEGLRFYLEAALEYLKGDAVATEEWDFPTGLLCSLMCQIEHFNVDSSLLPLIKEVGEYCKHHTEKLDLDEGCELYQGYIKSIEEAEQVSGGNGGQPATRRESEIEL